MNIKELRKKTGMTQAAFANRFSIPLRTLQEWEQGRSMPPQYVIPMIREVMLRSQQQQDNFYLFRSAIQHEIKRKGLLFVSEIIQQNDIAIYYAMGEYLKCLYLLACVDTLCDQYALPLCANLDPYRTLQLTEPVYLNRENVNSTDEQVAFLPVFQKYNIYEVTIYDAC